MYWPHLSRLDIFEWLQLKLMCNFATVCITRPVRNKLCQKLVSLPFNFVLVCISCFELFQTICNKNKTCIAMSPPTQSKGSSGHNIIWWVMQRPLWTILSILWNLAWCNGHIMTSGFVKAANQSLRMVYIRHNAKISRRKTVFYISFERIISNWHQHLSCYKFTITSQVVFCKGLVPCS